MFVKIKSGGKFFIIKVCDPNSEDFTPDGIVVSIVDNLNLDIEGRGLQLKDRDGANIDFDELPGIILQYANSNYFFIELCLDGPDALGSGINLKKELESYLKKGDFSSIFNEYDTKQTLSDCSRRNLVRESINFLRQRSGNYPNREDKIALAEAIVNLFPTYKVEKSDCGGIDLFFNPAANTGYLVAKLKNLNSKRRKLTAPSSKAEKKQESDSDSDDENRLSQEDLDFFQNCLITDKLIIKEKLQQTVKARIKYCATQEHVLQVFPIFLFDSSLILFDFELRYGVLKANELFNNWDKYKYFVGEISDEAGGQCLESFSGWSEDTIPFLNLLKLLPSTAGGRETKRVKLNDSVESFITFEENLGKAPLTYQKFLGIVEKLKVPAAEDKPEKLTCSLPCDDTWEQKDKHCYDVPTTEDLVKKPEELGIEKFPGGESEALKRLNSSLADETWVALFEKPNTSPNSLEPSTTVLSPYLKFGCLSSRLMYQRLKEILKRHSKHSKPPVSLMGQLMWREFYYTAAAYEPNFDRMMGNSFCMQIPWQTNETHLEAWTYGRTGYPFIDAIMRQLRQEGWIHHLARHAVACFLTRGDLWISWEEGQKVFEELLLDQDWALNAGNWMWLSASAFFHQYFRVYSPVAFGKKTDPSGNYIRKYVPELAKYPAGAIYEPWKVSLAEQRKYGCILGTDYPHRIVNHEVIHKDNIKRMSAAYKVNREVKTGKQEDDEESSGGKRKATAKVSAGVKKQKKK